MAAGLGSAVLTGSAAAPVAGTRDVLDRYLCDLPQRAAENGGPAARQRSTRTRVGDHAQLWEKIVTKLANRRDAASGPAAAGCRHVSRGRGGALERALDAAAAAKPIRAAFLFTA